MHAAPRTFHALPFWLQKRFCSTRLTIARATVPCTGPLSLCHRALHGAHQPVPLRPHRCL
eukprot:6142834-Pyramimonas_sp.AAC.1